MIRESVMKKLLFSFFLICCAVPLTAEAADLFNTNGSFKVAKAVKLGRGSAYSVSASSNVNTGGKISSKKTCSAGCSDCDTSTGWCNACMSRYAKDNAGKCHPCPSNCASCWMEYATRQPDFATHAKHDTPKTTPENATAAPVTAPAAGWNTAIR